MARAAGRGEPVERPRSDALFERAEGVLAGGVSSPVRAFGSVGGTPVVFDRGEGAWLVDVDGNRYLDLVMSWGALILGHAHPGVVSSVAETLERGTSFGAPCVAEVELAEAIRAAMPSMERLRMVSSGTEAVMSALRLARAYTGRDRIVKFRGCYHGHADSMLVRAGSGVATLGLPDSPGVTSGSVADTLLADYNDLRSVESLLSSRGDEVAAVIVEPVAGNMGLVPPAAGFLQGLRELTESVGALLVFDEVMTGFRVGPGGAQGRYGVTPDLSTVGKVVGGGMPVGAFGGRADVMEWLAPIGPVYQAGTLSGNPVAMSAGVATLRALNEEVWTGLEEAAARIVDALRREAIAAGVPLQAEAVGAMFGFFFCEGPVTDWGSAVAVDRDRFRSFFHAMLAEGVYLAPSPFEAGFVSAAHGPEELAHFERAVRAAMRLVG